MMKKIIILAGSFITVFAAHFFFNVVRAEHLAKKWVSTDQPSAISVYFLKGDYFIGLSFALAISFTIYAIMKYVDSRKKTIGGIAGGITLTGVLYFGLCFLLGCCGSPMLVVYLGLFGPTILHFTKPLTLLLTVISIIVGVVLLERKKKATCASDCDCDHPIKYSATGQKNRIKK